MDGDKCDGECGAVEEHAMYYDEEDLLKLSISPKRVFSSAGHYPLIAGYTASGEPLYCESTGGVAVPNGVRAGKVRIKVHYADGSTEQTLETWEIFQINVLRYNPQAYKLSGLYSSRGEEAGGMDATGPFSWKFHRKLPDIQPREEPPPNKTSNHAARRLWAIDEAPVCAPERLWREFFFEPDEDSSVNIFDRNVEDAIDSDESDGEESTDDDTVEWAFDEDVDSVM